MTGAWHRWSGTLALSTERDFERLSLPFLRVFWPTLDQAPARKEWDKKGIDLLVWSEGTPFPCAVQCKGFAVQDIGHDQFLQVRDSIKKFHDSGVRVHTYLLIHNRDGRNLEFREKVQALLRPIVDSGHAVRAELWDRQQLLTNCRSELEKLISKGLQDNARALLDYYATVFSFGATYLDRVPVTESSLVFRRFQPCTMTAVRESSSLRVSELVMSPTEARWTLLTGNFGAGKTTTVLHAAASTTKSPVLIECRSLPSTTHELSSTSLLLEEGLKSLCIFESVHEADREVLYEVAGSTFKGMLMSPEPNFVLILDGLDENRFYSQLPGMQFLSNQLADLKCPIILTTRREHLNAMFGDFSAAFQEFSIRFSPKREARLLELNSWSREQSLALCDLVIEQAEGEARARLAIFRNLLSADAAADLYGDLPSNPLMLRFILEEVAEAGIHQSTRPELLESWMRRKIRRDRTATKRISANYSLDLEEVVQRMMEVMEAIAIKHVTEDSGRLELLERISVEAVREAATSAFGYAADNLLGIVLNSFLLPLGPTTGQERSFAFAFRIVQEYLVARHLKRIRATVQNFPDSVQNLCTEMVE